jgi:hypothetical protein
MKCRAYFLDPLPPPSLSTKYLNKTCGYCYLEISFQTEGTRKRNLFHYALLQTKQVIKTKMFNIEKKYGESNLCKHQFNLTRDV